MRNLFLITFFLISLFSSAQRVDESSDITVRMELKSVFEMHQISKNCIRVANTETVVLNFCDYYFKLTPGVHQVNVDIPESCQIWLSEITGDQLEGGCKEKRTIPNALKTIDYFSSQIIRIEDLIEFKFCN